MLKLVFFGLIKVVVVWSLAIYVSALVCFAIAKDWLLRFGEKPWQSKKREEPPRCLRDPKYGVHKYVRVNKVRLHYVEKGDRNKPLMLFVHGFPEFWYSWRHQITEFSSDYWTVALDIRGYGDSDRPKGQSNYTIEKICDDIKAVIEHLNRKQCILVCHDWGAVIGWTFIDHFGAMVQKYILMGAPSPSVWAESLRDSPDQFWKSLYIFFFQMPYLPEIEAARDDYQIFKHLNDAKFSDYFTPEDLEAYKYTFSQRDALTSSIALYRANFPYFKTPEPSKVPNEGADGLFVLGQLDRYISHSSCILLSKLYPKLRVEVVPHVNHFLQQNDPVSVNALMKDFLGKSSDYTVEVLRHDDHDE